MTLAELLVAMLILLVGIYAIARGFPSLFGNLESERIRTETARRVQARMENLKTTAWALPEAITGHDPLDASVIESGLYPDENQDPVPGNPRDDLTWVIGETFNVPIAQPGQAYSVYSLNLGPATVQNPAVVGDYLQVSRLVALERTDVGTPLGDDQFYVDEDGYLYAPAAYASAEVDYVWVDENGECHGVLGELVDNINANAAALPVRAVAVVDTPAFVNVLPDQCAATALEPFTTVIGQPANVASGRAVLESNYGATLLLSSADANETLQVNYQQMTEADSMGSPRRVPFMMEEMAAPTQPPYQVDLAFRGIDDANPLFSTNLLGAAFTDPVYVLIVDTQTGDAWTDAEDWVGLDFIESKLTLDWDDASAPMTAVQARGHDLRVYYRTIAGHTVVVQKAPAWFVEDYTDAGRVSIHDTYVTDGLADSVDYRYYQLGADLDDATYARLLFPNSAANQIVAVDYMAGAAEPYDRISGELHVISGDTLGFTLNEPNVRGVLAVRGVSVTVRGWWHVGSGRVEMVGIDTFLTPEPLL